MYATSLHFETSYLVEIIEWNSSHSSSDSWGHCLATIAHKIGNREYSGRFLHALLLQLEVPVVRQLQRQSRVIRSLNHDDVSHEVGPQQQTKTLDHISTFRFATRDAQLSELLIWSEHDQVGTKHNSRFLHLVIVDLTGCVVRHSENKLFSDRFILSFGLRKPSSKFRFSEILWRL